MSKVHVLSAGGLDLFPQVSYCGLSTNSSEHRFSWSHSSYLHDNKKTWRWYCVPCLKVYCAELWIKYTLEFRALQHHTVYVGTHTKYEYIYELIERLLKERPEHK